MSSSSFLRFCYRAGTILILLATFTTVSVNQFADAASDKSPHRPSLAEWTVNAVLFPSMHGLDLLGYDGAFEPPDSRGTNILWMPSLYALPPVKRSAPEPFGSRVEPVMNGNLVLRWKSAKARIDADLKTVAKCRLRALSCPSSVRKFLAIRNRAEHRSGLAQIGEVNRSINLSIRPMSDIEQYGVSDYWASPLELLTRGAGDCEDYAIAKYAILRDLGIDEHRLRIIIVHDSRLQQDHAVVSVRTEGRWRLLDNRTLYMVNADDADRYEPLFVMGQAVSRVTSYGHAPVDYVSQRVWPGAQPSILE